MKDLSLRSCLCAIVLSLLTLPGLPARGLVLGVDVSQWQFTIDWATFVSQNQVDFAYIKYTDSSTLVDPRAARNVSGATAQGVPLGVYHFATPFSFDRNTAQDFNNNDAVEEAEWFVERAGGQMGPGFLPPVLDIEVGEAAGRTRLTNWSKTFLDTVENLTGVRPIIYANQNWVTNYLTASELDTELWIARWTEDPNIGPSTTGSWDDYMFHQYTASAVMAGVTQNTVDRNTFNGTIEELMAIVNPIPPLVGDYDDDGTVGQGDLNMVLLNWGLSGTPTPIGWVNDVPEGVIGQENLNTVLLNWGNTNEAASASAVPEPGTLAALALSFGLVMRRRSAA